MSAEGEPPAIELRALDPARDPARWGELARRVGAEAAARRRRALFARQLRAQGRVAVLAAAAVTVGIWGGALARGAERTAPTSRADPLFAVAAWAAAGEAPGTPDLLGVLEQLDGR